MFSDEILKKIFAHEEMQKIPVSTKATAVHVFEEILEDILEENPYASISELLTANDEPISKQLQSYVKPTTEAYADGAAIYAILQQNQFVQQPVQQNQPQGIIGKIISEFSEITANDVLMNGHAVFFPKADGSEIQVRSWAANGTIQTIVYKPILDKNAE